MKGKINSIFNDSLETKIWKLKFLITWLGVIVFARLLMQIEFRLL